LETSRYVAVSAHQCLSVFVVLTSSVESFFPLLLTLNYSTFKATSRIISISLWVYCDSPEALEKLLSWPKVLYKFTLAPFYQNDHYIDLPMIKQMLFPHRESLTDLDIGYFSASGTGKFCHWSEFPNLENLALSRWLFESSRETPGLPEFQDELADYILAPGLKRFTLAFAIWDDDNEEQ
jgi:hypothetical protein